MGRELAATYAEARAVYAEADEALGESLSSLCFEGPEERLNLTANTQPAILTTSIAVYRVLAARGPIGDVVAGHSLGEWSALVAAGTLSLADAVRLTRLRGQAMQDAVPVGQGAMAALMGLDAAQVEAVCAEAARAGEPVSPANFNGAGQIVISGAAAAVERAIAGAKAAGAKRAVPLAVSAPFHCALMAPAAEAVRAALAGVSVAAPRVPVVTNVEATACADPARLRELLVAQVTQPVRWEACVLQLATLDVTRAWELGAGSVLRGLVKRIAPSLETTSLGEPHEVAAFLPKES